MKRFKLNLSVVALIIGAGIAVTQSSFRPAQDLQRWGVQADGSFVNITEKVEDDTAHPAVNTYRCQDSDNICSGSSDTMPTNTSNLSDTKSGDFSLN